MQYQATNSLSVPIFVNLPALLNFEEQRSLPRETCPFFCLTGAYLSGACPLEFTCDSGAYSSGVGRSYRIGVKPIQLGHGNDSLAGSTGTI